jgi:hypothetical protein
MNNLQLPEMGPVKDLLATLASAAALVKTWLEIRDATAAKESRDNAYKETLSMDNVDDVVSHMESVIPLEVWDRLRAKLKSCSDRFCEILDSDGKYFPQVVDDATIPYRICICKVLSMILQIYGKFPQKAQSDVWVSWNCPVLLGENH